MGRKRQQLDVEMTVSERVELEDPFDIERWYAGFLLLDELDRQETEAELREKVDA